MQNWPEIVVFIHHLQIRTYTHIYITHTIIEQSCRFVVAEEVDEVVVSVEEAAVDAVSEVVEVEVAEECVMKAHLMWLLVRLFSSHL